MDVQHASMRTLPTNMQYATATCCHACTTSMCSIHDQSSWVSLQGNLTPSDGFEEDFFKLLRSSAYLETIVMEVLLMECSRMKTTILFECGLLPPLCPPCIHLMSFMCSQAVPVFRHFCTSVYYTERKKRGKPAAIVQPAGVLQPAVAWSVGYN